MNNGTPMARMAARTRAGVDPARVAYLAKRGLELDVVFAQVTADVAQVTVDGALDGSEEFSGLNVGGTDVKPFLDKTDGEKLVDSTGLDAGVVIQDSLSVTAIRPGPVATNPALVPVLGLASVGGDVNAAGAATFLTTTFIVTEATNTTLVFGVPVSLTDEIDIELALFVDYGGVHSMQAIRNMEAADPTCYRVLSQPDPAGGDISTQIVTTKTLTAGSHTVLVLGMSRGSSVGGEVPAGAAALQVFLR